MSSDVTRDWMEEAVEVQRRSSSPGDRIAGTENFATAAALRAALQENGVSDGGN